MKKQSVLASMILVVFFATTCWAGTASDDMAVGVTVVTTCSVTANDLTFPDYDGSTDIVGETTLDINCSDQLAVTIDIAQGTDGANDNRAFDMGGPEYQLYIDSGYTQIWGDYLAAGQAVSYTGTGADDSMPVYGKIPASQTVDSHLYSTTVTAVLTW